MFKMNNCETQKATTYIAYMLIGSYFNKAVFFNKRQEQRLFLDYREMPVSKQYKTEETIIKRMNRLLFGRESQFSDLNCFVTLTKEGNDYHLLFDTEGFGKITACIQESGKIVIDLDDEAAVSSAA